MLNRWNAPNLAALGISCGGSPDSARGLRDMAFRVPMIFPVGSYFDKAAVMNVVPKRTVAFTFLAAMPG
jgi:hypothetical protein